MFLDDLVGLAGFHDAEVILLVLLRQFLREEIEIGLADDVLQLQLEMPAVLLVGKSEPALDVPAKHILRHRLDQRMVQGFRVPHALLRLPPLGDVLDRALVVEEPALRIPNGAAILRNPNHRAVLPIDLRLKPGDGVLFLHQPDKLIAPALAHIKPPPDVGKALHQLLRRE